MYIFHILLTAQETAKLEDQIDTLYKVISYGIPLMTALALALTAAFYTITRAVKRNTSNISTVAKSTNGNVTAIRASVDAMHRRLDSIGVQEGYDSNAETAESSGGTGTSTRTPTNV